MQQALFGLGHHQRRHEVLEHRARPGLEARRHPHAQKRTAQRLPVAARHVALGNRQVAGQARLGRQQVVIAGVQGLAVHPQTNVKQVPPLAVQAAEIHRHAQLLQALGQLGQRCRLLRRARPVAGQRHAGLRDGQQMAGQVATVDR